MQGFLSENTCRLCAKDMLLFTPPSISCSSCRKLVECNADFYRTNNEINEQVTILKVVEYLWVGNGIF